MNRLFSISIREIYSELVDQDTRDSLHGTIKEKLKWNLIVKKILLENIVIRSEKL